MDDRSYAHSNKADIAAGCSLHHGSVRKQMEICVTPLSFTLYCAYPDSLYPAVLKAIATRVAQSLTDLFNRSIVPADVPDD